MILYGNHLGGNHWAVKKLRTKNRVLPTATFGHEIACFLRLSLCDKAIYKFQPLLLKYFGLYYWDLRT